ncbi:MAG TPA: M23 family metallopeptidase, partial [Chitinispirillaceae bacterium]|nr:M23 family metallopeptidase [Chitinispirillaceae bacterium]
KLKLEIKDMEGPEELVHNKSGTYIVKFNRKASDNERNKVSWVVRINGKETDRFENAGETLEFTPIGKYAGETVTVHPFLRSPSDSLCVKATVGECLVFDGSKLIWLDKKHDEKEKWEAVTGKGDNSDPKKEDGPIPEGRWVVLQTKREIAEKDNWWENLINRKTSSDSANERIGLIPFSTTDTHKRDEEFYIHGSKEADIVPGINLGKDINDFIDSFVNSGKNLVLVVRYTELSQNNKFNNLDEKDMHSERKFNYLHPLGRNHNFQVTSPYGLRSLGMHYGIDYGVPEGTPLYAVTNADVERSYFHKGYGETVYINDGKNTFVYAHLSERSVKSGSKLQKGQIIGYSGNTGRSTGPHLHFEVRINEGIYPSNTLNPQEFGF